MALTTNLTPLSIRENTSFAMVPPQSVIGLVLQANVAVDIDIADLEGANGVTPNVLNFASTTNFYLGWNTTGLAVPVSNILDGSAPELNPSVRKIGANITSFSIVAPSAGYVQIALFSINN